MPNDEDMSGDMGALAQARASRDQLFADAMKRLRDDRVGPTAAERLFAISKALSRPTRTGSFFEELGNVGGVLGAQEAEKRKAQMERAAMLEKYGFGQSDATIAGLESQINMRMKMQEVANAQVKAKRPIFRGNVKLEDGTNAAVFEDPTTGALSTAPIDPNTFNLNASAIPLQAIVDLKTNPALADQFDIKYGPGNAKLVLGDR